MEFKLFPGKKKYKEKNYRSREKEILRKIELKIAFLKPSRAKMVYPKPTELLKHILCKNHEKKYPSTIYLGQLSPNLVEIC